MSVLHTLTAFVVALGALVIVHEYGHYLVARLCSIKVLRFSIGFGPALWKRRIGRDRTEWVVAAIPLGGYVKMLDEREGEVTAAERARAFNRQNVWIRCAVVVAGPLANFLFAILLYWLLFMNGVQEAKPLVDTPPVGTLAASAGFARGETILRLNGDAVNSWSEVRWRLLQLALEEKQVSVETLNRHNQLNWRNLDLMQLRGKNIEGDVLAEMGLKLYRPDIPPVIGQIVAGSVAERAGLQRGDRIASVDGRALATWNELVQFVRSRPGERIDTVVVRDGRELELTLVPEAVKEGGSIFGRIGAAAQVDAHALEDLITRVRYGPIAALTKSLDKTWDTSVFSLKMLGRMILGQVSWRNLSGPVTIADYAGQSAQLGIVSYLNFLALISISLGVLNLLPIPLLDGGHLMYYTVEICKGSPVSDQFMEIGQKVGLALLLVLMAFAFYNDINRLISG